MSGANSDSLRFRPADTASLPMVEDEQSYRMGEVVVPNISEGLGLMLTGESNMVGDMHPEGPGAQGGMMVGDVILAVDDRVVTSVDWRPSEDAGVVLCKEPHALEPAGLALDRTKPSVTLKVLRPVELRREETAPPSLAEELAAARGHVPVGQEVPSPQRPPAQPPMYVAEQRPPTPLRTDGYARHVPPLAIFDICQFRAKGGARLRVSRGICVRELRIESHAGFKEILHIIRN